MVTKRTKGEYIFDFFNILIMILMIIITFYPMYYVITCSFSDSKYLLGDKGLMLLPKGFSFESYKAVLQNPNIMTGYRTTLIVVAAGTILNVFMTSFAAFLLTRDDFRIKKALTCMMIFTMYFSGGMIPSYLLIYKFLNLGDTLLALILPGAISTYNMIIMRTNFAAIPKSLEESAYLDGANEIVMLFRIIMPLSLPIIAVMVLFYGVGHWNAWFNAMLYMRSRSKYPLQLILREILLINSTDSMAGNAGAADKYMIGESIKYATTIVATLPILFVYPFIQKYFVKGMMVGAVKG